MIKSTLFRQRRRIVFSSLTSMLGASVMFGAGVSAIIASLGMVVLSCAVLLGAPKFRKMIECLSLGFLLTASLPLLAVMAGPVTAFATLLFYGVLYGGWADFTPLRLKLVSKRIAQTNVAPEVAWGVIVPGESHPDDYWTGTLVDFDHDADDADTVYLRFEVRDEPHREMTLTFLEKAAPERCRYYLEQDDDGETDPLVFALRLERTGADKTLIFSTLEQDRMLPRQAIARWFDDSFGDELAQFAETISSKRTWAVKPVPRAEARQFALPAFLKA